MHHQGTKTSSPRSSRGDEAQTSAVVKDHWRFASLEEVAILQRGRFSPRPRTDPRYYGGRHPFIQTGDVESPDGFIRSYKQTLNEAGLAVSKKFGAGTLVISIAANIGSVGILTFDSCMPDSLVGVTAKEGKSDNLFLYYTLLSLKSDLQKLAPAMAQANLNLALLAPTKIRLPELPEQRRIAARLREQMAEVERARAAVQAQLDAAQALGMAVVRESAKCAGTIIRPVPECIQEVTQGIGEGWNKFPVLGATRAGLAPAKEGVGKKPGRYKPVVPGTIFYNPMRILLGSIAMIDEDDAPGITSPDYVVMTAAEGVLHPVWFYHWFRSPAGDEFIKSLTRGAVRERLLFKRLCGGRVPVPPWAIQVAAASQLREAKRLQRSLAARLAEIERLPAALLREAFSGGSSA